ncbi:hypothetical protein OEZ85_010593 [Tetradesmus obliquus]|uniref:EF-hand domain-containing protein n=1 Tax=Tetradesmus obliquus TaxID=3088 RepID=A0ABY8TQ20_TETOB|nr:hypothetical protein OEZ85_010593 [Tetradesmus obliquus]
MAAAAAASPVALADKSSALPPVSAVDPEPADGVVTGGSKLLPLSMRQRIFFKYEKRIRDLSSLEKIYEYFATHEHAGTKVMTSQDVVRALVPTYPPVGSNVVRAGFLDGERGHSQDSHEAQQQLLHFFDRDQSGTLDFNEFVLIVICLSVPEKDIEVVFDVMDLDNNGVIDEEEFKQVLAQLERRAGIQQGFHSRAGKHAIVDRDQPEMVHRLFQEAGAGVHLSKFRAFLQRLQEGMLRLEFAHYDTAGKGSISGADLANSLVTAADVRRVDALLDKAEQLPPQLAAARISYKDFKAMAALRSSIYSLYFALDFCTQIERPLSREDFAKLISKTLRLKLPATVMDVLMHVFGDEQGRLDGTEFVQVMKRRNKVPGYKRGPVGISGSESEGQNAGPVVSWLNCCWQCTVADKESRD